MLIDDLNGAIVVCVGAVGACAIGTKHESDDAADTDKIEEGFGSKFTRVSAGIARTFVLVARLVTVPDVRRIAAAATVVGLLVVVTSATQVAQAAVKAAPCRRQRRTRVTHVPLRDTVQRSVVQKARSTRRRHVSAVHLTLPT